MTDEEIKARRWSQWWSDPVRAEVMAEIQEAQVKVFLNAASTQEDRDEAHEVVRAIRKLEQRIHLAGKRAVAEQHKGQHRGND